MKTDSLHTIIKARLKERGQTLDELLKFMKITRQGYGKAIKRNIRLNQVEQIAIFLEIPLPELLLPLYYTKSEKELIQASINMLKTMKSKT